MDTPTETLRALPLQIIESGDHVLLKRGCTVLKIAGEGAGPAVHTVLSKLSSSTSTCEEILREFAAPQRDLVRQLIEKFIAKRLVVSVTKDTPPSTIPETHLDIFYWHFGDSPSHFSKKLSSQRIIILGVNSISRQLASSLVTSGAGKVEVVDDPLFRNLNFFDEGGHIRQEQWLIPPEIPIRDFQEWTLNSDPESFDCLVCTSDFGGLTLLQKWNQFCVDHNRHFLPVVLQDQIGYVGPLVVPGETACFECFLSRQDSQRPNRDASKQIEEAAYEGQGVVGFHPSMASILGDIATMELTKFYGRTLPGWNVGTMIEVNLLSTRITPRKVLKIPRCPVCSPLLTHPSTNPHKTLFSSTNGSGR